MGKAIALCMTLLLCNFIVRGQDGDPLKQTWSDVSLPDTVRLKALDALIWKYYVRNRPDSAALLARTQLELAERSGSAEFTARAHAILGTVANQMGDRANAIAHFDESLSIAQRIGIPEGISAELTNLGTVYLAAGDHARAVDLFTRSIAISEKGGDAASMAKAILNIGNIFYQQEDGVAALDYYDRSMEQAILAGDTAMMVRVLSISGGLLFDQGDTVSAFNRFTESLSLNERTGDKWGSMEALVNLGVAKLRTGQGEEALVLFQRTLEIANELNDTEGKLVALSSMADANLNPAIDRPKEAVRFAEQALRIASDYGNADWKRQVCMTLYQAYKILGLPGKALTMHETMFLLQDSIMSMSNQRAAIRSDVRYRYEKQAFTDSLENAHAYEQLQNANTIERLRADRNLNRALGLGGIALLLAIIALLLWRGLRTRDRLAKKEHELHTKNVDQLLSQQEIKSINAMLEGQEKERDRVGKDLHDRLGSMLGGIKAQLGVLEDRVEQVQQDAQFKKVHRLLDETVGELRQISHDMAASTLSRFGLEKALKDLRDTIHISGRLSVELNAFGLEQRLERSVEIAVYRIIQELVSNVLKHAKASELSIAVTRTPGRLSVMVTDNGIGFDTGTPKEGMGLENVRSRSAALGGTVQVDSTPGAGSTVSVECPIIE